MGLPFIKPSKLVHFVLIPFGSTFQVVLIVQATGQGGRCFEISSHFIPSPLSFINRASSSGVHLDCFLDGELVACSGSDRFRVGDVEACGGGASLSSCSLGAWGAQRGDGRRG